MHKLAIASMLLLQGCVVASNWQPRQLMDFSTGLCRSWGENSELAPGDSVGSVEKSDIERRGRKIGVKHRISVGQESLLEFDVIGLTGQNIRFVSTLYVADGYPSLLLSLSSDCSLQIARKINYSDKQQALNIVPLNASLEVTGEPEWLNPPLVFIERDSDESLKQAANPGQSALRVGMVDSGVNYQLPLINQRLARDADGKLVGYDFWDMDELPYDSHPRGPGFFVQHHGTRTASLLLREAPGIELVPYRYPRPDMSRMKALVEHAARHQVSILGMPLGSNRLEDWQEFEQAARDHPDMLFIASAGNNGRDIDDQAVYPAALELNNMLVVTSADDFVRPAERTNWGRSSVDYLIPAEKVAVTDYSGKEIKASGSSYAVARMTALAARLKMLNRQWKASDIIAELHRRFGAKEGENLLKWVTTGYIADPLAGRPIKKTPYPELRLKESKIDPIYRLPLDILVLDARWTHARVEQAVQQAYDILGQCGIAKGEVSIHSISGEDYLRDLSTGSARTLLEAVGTKVTTLVFARDTRMQDEFAGEAFGLGNTSARPWLSNSLWLMPDIEDEGIALAHELFHVVANSGEHIEDPGNLMRSRTRPQSTELIPRQCQQIQANGTANKLLTGG